MSRVVGDSTTRRVGVSFYDYEYLRQFEAKTGTARNVVEGTYAEPVYAKTSENPTHCHVPLRKYCQPKLFSSFLLYEIYF